MMTVGIRGIPPPVRLPSVAGRGWCCWLPLPPAFWPSRLCPSPVRRCFTPFAPKFLQPPLRRTATGWPRHPGWFWAADGCLYGTTLHGGANGAGSIFRMTITGSLSNLFSFPAATNESGGVNYDLGPNDLVQGTNGNFYGTTRRGGSNFTGTIFEISPSGSFANLHTFAAETINSSGHATSADGATPVGALAQGNRR